MSSSTLTARVTRPAERYVVCRSPSTESCAVQTAQWLLQNASSTTSPRCSDNLTLPPVAAGRAKSGASSPTAVAAGTAGWTSASSATSRYGRPKQRITSSSLKWRDKLPAAVSYLTSSVLLMRPARRTGMTPVTEGAVPAKAKDEGRRGAVEPPRASVMRDSRRAGRPGNSARRHGPADNLRKRDQARVSADTAQAGADAAGPAHALERALLSVQR